MTVFSRNIRNIEKIFFSSFYRKESTGRAQNTKEVMKIWYVLKMLIFHVFHVDMLWCRFIWSLSVLFHLLYLYVNKNTVKLIIFFIFPCFCSLWSNLAWILINIFWGDYHIFSARSFLSDVTRLFFFLFSHWLKWSSKVMSIKIFSILIGCNWHNAGVRKVNFSL